MKKRFDDSMLGTQPIGKLLARMSLPGILAMMVQALYNLVDAIFVGRGVGTAAIGGLAIAFPFQMLIMAFGSLFGFGAASVISRNLGSGNRERAYIAAGNVLAVTSVLGILVMIIGYAALDPILRLFGATETLLGFSRDYISIILIGAVFITFAMASNSIVRSEGRAMVAMITMLIGAGMNIILDPIFIFGFRMGIKGAATATVISQGLSFLFLVIYFASGKSSLEIKARHFRPDRSVLGEITLLGVPAFIRQSGTSILGIIINNALGKYGGDIYISAFGVLNRLMMFGLMPLFGIVQGFQPIAGYNYGAKRFDRVRSVIKVSVATTTGMSLFFFLVVMLIPRLLISIFTKDQNLIEAASSAGQVMFMVIPFIGIQVIGAGFFQAIGKAIPSLLLGLSRQILILIPLVLLLPLALGLRGVWLSFPLADLTATMITVALWVNELRKMRVVELQLQPA